MIEQAAPRSCTGQVIEPRVRAFLYTWGEGRLTAEGERIPGEWLVRVRWQGLGLHRP